MNERTLRKWTRRLLRDLGVQPPLDINQLCELISNYRNRPIVLFRYPLVTPGPPGMWFELDDLDVIVYQKNTSPIHQAHVQGHEVGHILAGHSPDQIAEEKTAAALREAFGCTPPVGRARTCYDTAAEREAEVIATTILQWASVLDPLFPRGGSSTTSRDLDYGLSARLGWL